MLLKLSTTLLALILLSGCAANMAKYPEMTLNDEHHLQSAEFVLKVTEPTAKPLLQCVEEKVSCPDVHLQDQFYSIPFAFTPGIIFMPAMHKTVAGQNVILSESGTEVFAINITQYKSGINGTKSLRYKLLVTQQENSVRYIFTDIKRAMEKTGFSKNKGFFYIGDWTSDFDQAYKEMKKTAESINQCLTEKK